MFVYSFFSSVIAARATACAARTHVMVAAAPAGAGAPHASRGPQAVGPHRIAAALLRSAAKLIARAALRAAYVGNPLTPTGYAILAMTVVAVALVAMLSTSSVSNELESALRVSWWFS